MAKAALAASVREAQSILDWQRIFAGAFVLAVLFGLAGGVGLGRAPSPGVPPSLSGAIGVDLVRTAAGVWALVVVLMTATVQDLSARGRDQLQPHLPFWALMPLVFVAFVSTLTFGLLGAALSLAVRGVSIADALAFSHRDLALGLLSIALRGTTLAVLWPVIARVVRSPRVPAIFLLPGGAVLVLIIAVIANAIAMLLGLPKGGPTNW
jgi:hypothetical protein